MERWTLILSGFLVAGASMLARADRAMAVAVGAGLMCVNAAVVHRLGARVMRRVAEGRPALAVLLFNLKMFGLFFCVYAGLRLLHLEAIGFLVGVSVFPVALVAGALTMQLDDEPEAEAVTASASLESPPSLETGHG